MRECRLQALQDEVAALGLPAGKGIAAFIATRDASNRTGGPLDEAMRESPPLLARSLAMVVYLLVFLAPWLALVALMFGSVRARRALRKPQATV